MSPTKKLVVVTAATGSQGLPIATYLLRTNRYAVRAVTRKIDSPQALLLKELGAEVVTGDYDNSLSLKAAFSGAEAIFCNTNFWEHMSIDDEIRQGLAIAKAAAEEPSLKNFIYSYLADARVLLNGKYQHNLVYNAKSITLERIETEFPRLYEITTKFSVAFYYDNWLKYQLAFGPIKRQDGVLEMAMPYPPTSKFPVAAPEDAGIVIAAILDSGDTYYGRWISLVSDRLSDNERIAQWTNVLGVEIAFKQVSPEEYQQRLEAAGWPKHIALATNQLCSLVGSGVDYLEVEGMVRAKDIIDPAYHLKTWKEYVAETNWADIL